MKEYKAMVHFEGKHERYWYTMSGRNATVKRFRTFEDADRFAQEMIDYHKEQRHKDYEGATYKIVERTVTDWTDCK